MQSPNGSHDALEALLNRAGHAHGQYETTVLNGVYDTDWHRWYARWAVDNGLNAFVPQPMDADQWSEILFTINADHQQTNRQESWAAYTARQILARYG
jgi:hypothetical protein